MWAALDTYGELAQMGIIAAIQGDDIPDQEDGEETNDFSEDRLSNISRANNGPLQPFGYELFAGITLNFCSCYRYTSTDQLHSWPWRHGRSAALWSAECPL